MLHYYEISNSEPLYCKRPKTNRYTNVTLQKKKLVLFNLYRCQFVKINTLPIAVQKYNIKNLKSYCILQKGFGTVYQKKKKRGGGAI